LTNSNGTVTDEYEYDAYGNSFTKSGTTPNNYLYRGEQYDSDLALYYLRARYYNPATGRFLSRDPEDGKLTDPASLHKYLYANGDPINGIDPRGHAATIETLFTISDISSPVTVRAVVYTGLSVAGCFWGIYRSLEALLVERSLPTVVDGFFVVAGCTMTFFPLPAD
jgi:RHS repeat-associated protein